MARFELLAGKHHQDGKTYKTGEIVESAGDLVERFGPHRFRKLVDPVLQGLPSSPPAPEGGKKKLKLKRPAKEKDPRGEEEVTSDFPLAEEHGLRVFRRDRLYHVFEGEDDRPQNGTGLKKAQVEKFLVEFLDR